MMLERVLEPEVMDSAQDALDYDSMDHATVNHVFADDFLSAHPDTSYVLDVGTGTARIPIEICHRDPVARIVAIDLAPSMLDLGQANIAIEGLAERIRLQLVDAKGLPFADAEFSAVISNSIVHHIPEPRGVLAEMVRVVRPGGLIFVRDLLRPPDRDTLEHLVEVYAGEANEHQRQLFADSLAAALSLDEARGMAAAVGIDPRTVAATSDRHWTLSAHKI
ncbi:MAG: class I SAM-dependent methyltransferase [Pirellulales bacterium]|nr:class I SAM-dependent methyltransferase [Pirellulales bacterium]